MKPSLTLTLMFVAILTACGRGHSTPTTPSQPSNSVQQSNPIRVILTFFPQPAVANEATTFIASIAPVSSPASVTMDFGDGTRAEFAPLSPENSATLKHVYTRAGDFTATFSFRKAAGDTASGSVIVVVR